MAKYQYHKRSGNKDRSLCGCFSYRVDVIDDWDKVTCPKCLSLKGGMNKMPVFENPSFNYKKITKELIDKIRKRKQQSYEHGMEKLSIQTNRRLTVNTNEYSNWMPICDQCQKPINEGEISIKNSKCEVWYHEDCFIKRKPLIGYGDSYLQYITNKRPKEK